MLQRSNMQKPSFCSFGSLNTPETHLLGAYDADR
jgi:hypothetical protein